MGTGKNGTFDKIPDWQQWAVLTVTPQSNSTKKAQPSYGSFINRWYRFFNCEIFTMQLEPLEGRGTWDGKKAFGDLPPMSDYSGRIARVTRATIRLNKLKYFWENVAPVAAQMHTAKGFLFSAGIGEVPWIKQATFSIWDSREDMTAFAYGMKTHREVIQKTRKQQWYREDMFTRFRLTGHWGTIKGTDPLAGDKEGQLALHI